MAFHFSLPSGIPEIQICIPLIMPKKYVRGSLHSCSFLGFWGDILKDLSSSSDILSSV